MFVYFNIYLKNNSEEIFRDLNYNFFFVVNFNIIIHLFYKIEHFLIEKINLQSTNVFYKKRYILKFFI